MMRKTQVAPALAGPLPPLQRCATVRQPRIAYSSRCSACFHRRTRHNHRRGFALLFVFALAAAMAMLLYREMPRVLFEGQREKEELLIFRGEQYKRAIQVFVRKNKKYPASMEELERFQDTRYLRRRYKDPLTGKDEWRLIHFENGGFPDSLVYNKKPGEEGQAEPRQALVAENPFLGSQPAGAGQPASVMAGLLRRGSDRPAAAAGEQGAGLPYDPNLPLPPGAGAGNPGSAGQPLQPFPAAQQAMLQQGVQQPAVQQYPPPGQPFDPNQANQSVNPPVPGAPAVVMPGQVTPFQPGQAVPFQPGQPEPGQTGQTVPFQLGQSVYQLRQADPNQPAPSTPYQPQPAGSYQPGQPVQIQPGQSLFPGQPGATGRPAFPFVPGQPNPFAQQQQQQQSQPFIGGSSQTFIGGAVPTNPAPQTGYQQQYPAPVAQPYFPQQPPQLTFPQPQAAPRVPVSSQGGGAYPIAIPTPGGTAARVGGAPATSPNQALDLIKQILTTPRPGGLPGAGQQQAQASLGAGLAGVAPTVDAEGIKIYAERTNYKEWEFIYDAAQDKSAQLAAQGAAGAGPQGMPGQPGQPGRPGQLGQPGQPTQPGLGSPGPGRPGGFQPPFQQGVQPPFGQGQGPGRRGGGQQPQQPSQPPPFIGGPRRQ